MVDLDKFATSRQYGPATFITCKYCHQSLIEHFDHMKGHGILGYSGHTDDCDAILAGLTVDLRKEDRKKFLVTHTPLQIKLYDLLWDDWLKRMQKAFTQ